MKKSKIIFTVLWITFFISGMYPIAYAINSEVKKGDKLKTQPPKAQNVEVMIRLDTNNRIEVSFSDTENDSLDSKKRGVILYLISDGEVPVSKFYFIPQGEKLSLDPKKKFNIKAIKACSEVYTIFEKKFDGRTLPGRTEIRYTYESSVWMEFKIGNPFGTNGEIPDIFLAQDMRMASDAR